MNGLTPYKYCIVPECQSTTFKTPDKEFLRIPIEKKLRRKWIVAMKRDSLSETTTSFVCEDHFDVSNCVFEFVLEFILVYQLNSFNKCCHIFMNNNIFFLTSPIF